MKHQVLHKVWKYSFIGMILLFCVLMFLISLPYFAMDKHAPIQFLRTKLNVYHIDLWRIGFYTHVFTSVLILFAGATQFSSTLLRKRKSFHKSMGYIYVVVLLFFSGPGAFVMGMYANGGPPARASFMLLTPLWLTFTAMAWYYIFKRDFLAHGEFMFRSYALTFSAVTLRLYQFFYNELRGTALDPEWKPVETYIILSWLSWVPNMILAEILIRKGIIRRLLKRSAE